MAHTHARSSPTAPAFRNLGSGVPCGLCASCILHLALAPAAGAGQEEMVVVLQNELSPSPPLNAPSRTMTTAHPAFLSSRRPAAVSLPRARAFVCCKPQGMKEKMRDLAKSLGIPNPGALNM